MQTIIWPEGLSDTAVPAKWGTARDSRVLYEYLRERNWTTRSFVDHFPTNEATVPWGQAIPLNIQSYSRRANSCLTVETKYLGGADGMSPANYYVCVLGVVERTVVRSASSVWKLENIG